MNEIQMQAIIRVNRVNKDKKYFIRFYRAIDDQHRKFLGHSMEKYNHNQKIEFEKFKKYGFRNENLKEYYNVITQELFFFENIQEE